MAFSLTAVLNRYNQWIWRQRLRGLVPKVRRFSEQFPYAEVRPIPNQAFAAAVLSGKGPMPVTDCSGFYTAMLFTAGAPDPNGLNYDGEGYTGDCLRHLRRIAKSSLKFGDAVVFGIGPDCPGGAHMVMVIPSRFSRSDDPLVISHGRPGLDVMPLSQMQAGFSGETAYLAAFTPAGHEESK